MIKQITAACKCTVEFQKRQEGVPFPNFQRVTLLGPWTEIIKADQLWHHSGRGRLRAAQSQQQHAPPSFVHANC